MDEIEAKFTRKKFNGFKRQQKNGSDYEVAESLKFSAELEAMVGGGSIAAAKAVGIKAGYGDQYPSIALHVAMAKRLGVEMAGAFAKEEGVAYLAGESAEVANTLFAGMAEGMERKRVERGFPDSITRIIEGYDSQSYKASKLERERDKEFQRNRDGFMREGLDWQAASDKARAMVDPAVDAQLAEFKEYNERSRAEYNRVRREYADQHPGWFNIYEDGSVYMRDRKNNEVTKAMPRILFFKAIANNPGLALQDVTDKAKERMKGN
jgi:hypothetical protein